MEIISERTDDILELAIIGSLDTTTAPQLECAIKENVQNVKSISIDMKKTEYVSSAGLRVLFTAYMAMKKKKGIMQISGVNEEVMDVFIITGFKDKMDIRAKENT